MNKKKLLIIGGILILVIGTIFFFTNKGRLEKKVLSQTYNLSKEYLSLRYRTDNALLDAKNYSDYKTWNSSITDIIDEWEEFENKAKSLEEVANKIAETKEISFHFVENVYAYDKEEITRVFDKAPAGKKIATLAKHLGVDAKKAYAILKQDQAQVTADAWTEAGDTFEKLEASATVIKDGCKVAGFIGAVILTGGTAGLATASTLTKATIVVTGADLILEVTEDSANIALGDKNGVSAVTRGIRAVTEPIANIIAINNVPGNLGNAFGRFDSVMLGLEKFREAAQEGKVIGIQLIPGLEKFKVNSSLLMKYKEPVYISELKSSEVDNWLKEQKIEYENPTKEEVEESLGIKNKGETKDEKSKEKGNNTSKKGLISYNEWEEWGNSESWYKEDLIEKFGYPNITESKSGKQVWIYYDLVYYTSGETCSPVYTFYDTDQIALTRCDSTESVENIINNW